MMAMALAVVSVACSLDSQDEPEGAMPTRTVIPTPAATEPREVPPPTPVPGSDVEYRRGLVAALERLDEARGKFGDMLLTVIVQDISDPVWRAEFAACADDVMAAAVDVRDVDPPPTGSWVEVDRLIHRAMDKLAEATELYRAAVLKHDALLLVEAGACVLESDDLMEAAIAAIP